MRIVTACLLLGSCLAALGHAQDANVTGQDKKPKMRFTIGKDTTFVTEPVDKQGYIDYVTALNQRLRQGVTPDKNCCVLLWSVLGPDRKGVPTPPAYFDWLGVLAPPEKGEYFVALERYLKDDLKIDNEQQRFEISYYQVDQAAERAWSAKQFPQLASWLSVNEKPLALLIEAVKRPQYYSPLVRGKLEKQDMQYDSFPGPFGPSLLECRHALCARALMHAGEGRYDKAWQDLLVCHRLARHVARGGTLLDMWVAIAIDGYASRADVAFLESAKLDSKNIMQCLEDLKRLPPMPPVADCVDFGERFIFLDCVQTVDRHGFQVLELMGLGVEKGKSLIVHDKGLLEKTNWDSALKNGNKLFGQVVSALRVLNRSQREKQLEHIEGNRNKTTDLVKAGALKHVMVEGVATPEERGKVIGDLLSSVFPSVHFARKVQQGADRTEQIQRNLHVAFALVAFQRDSGAYPKQLKELAPKYLATVPDDLFAGKPLIYQPSPEGFLLSSVGVNGIDEQGRSIDDDVTCDDLPVRLPLPPLKK